MQERLRQARQIVTDKLQRFEGRDISKFCRAYEQAMEENGIQDREAIDGFHLIVVPKLKARIAKIQAQKGAEWQDFKKALKEKYSLEDSQRVTKQSFMKWIKQWNKGLFAQELLREFEKRYDQLYATEQCSIRSEWVELFVQAADALNVIVKRQMRVDKLIVVDSIESSYEEAKDKLATLKHKLEEPVLDDLVKGIQELNLNLKVVKLEGLSSKGSTSEYRPQLPRKVCMWCDSQDHERRDCDDFNLRATGEPICVNFGQGGMKMLAKEILHNVTMVDAATYGLQVISKAEEEDAKAYGELWPYALKMAEGGKCKRDEEAIGTSKRATRSSSKKEEVPKPLLEVNMEDAPKDKKQDVQPGAGNVAAAAADENDDEDGDDVDTSGYVKLYLNFIIVMTSGVCILPSSTIESIVLFSKLQAKTVRP
ncbi:hypothetical protein L7F22_054263 [Adiantum nelumboides]|nr:hypothetical protein [Adiantum nelumboides]